MVSTISTKGQTTIPEDIRKELSLQAGDRVVWELVNGKLIGTPTGDLMSLAGSLKSEVPYRPKNEMRKSAQAERVKRYAKKLAGK